MIKRYLSLCSLLLCAAVAAHAQPEPVNVRDFITKPEFKEQKDHTEAIRAAFAEAGKTRAYRVLFPPGYYTISDTIDISQGTPVSPYGASITQTDPEKDIFVNKGVWRIAIRNFSFYGGRDQVVLFTNNCDISVLEVSDCQFKDAGGVAVRMLKGSNSTLLKVKDCVFWDCNQALINHCDMAVLRDCWISTKQKQDNKAVIENYGVLTCQNIVGVPRVTYTDQRWIDNYGTLLCNTFRFGGEGAGFTPVVNYAKAGSVTMENCFAYALGNNKRACAVYCEEIPGQLIVRGGGGSVPAVKINPSIDVQKDLNTRQGAVQFIVTDYAVVDGNAAPDQCSGPLPKALKDAVARRKVQAIDFGAKQLSAAETKKALAAAVAAARRIPSAKAPGVMTYALPLDQEGHRQVADPAKYVEVTPKTHAWDLKDTLDGGAERNDVYLALAPAGDDVVLMSRLDEGSYPHLRIRNITVDLDKTPYLTWRLKDNGVKGGHQAMKVINNATEAMTTLMEDYYTDQFGYYAYDLRKALGVEHGTVNLDLKFYMCGTRQTGALSSVSIKKGEFFLVDFIRLEAAE